MRSWLPVFALLAACGFDDQLVGSHEAAPPDRATDWTPFPEPTIPFTPKTDPLRDFVIPTDELRGSDSHGSGLAVIGERLFVADRAHSRVMVMRTSDLSVENSIPVGEGPTQLVATPSGALYVTLESQNEVVRIPPGQLVPHEHIALEGGPWGIAVDQTGDVWVSLVAARALVRLDARLAHVIARYEVEGTPRGVCVDAGNRVAVVLQSGRLHLIDWRLDSIERDLDLIDGESVGFGTHAFGVASDPRGESFLVGFGVAHPERGVTGTWGLPIAARFTRVREGSIALSYAGWAIDQPAEIIHHPTLALAFVASTGDGTVTMLDTRVGVQPVQSFAVGAEPRALALSPSGSRLFVLLEGAFEVRSFDLDGFELVQQKTRAYADDPLPPEAQLGRELFFATGWGMSGTLACASCHVLGGADGIVWPMAEGARRTPALAGRIEGTAPYGWDGRFPTFRDALRDKIRRLGGSPENFSAAELAALETYVSHYLPEPARPVLVRQRGLRERGEALFRSEAAGCATCHAGETYSDDLLWDVETSDEPLNTPSLIDVFAGAPYFHDGSAPTLREVLRRHGPPLAAADQDALIAFLRSL